jgi:hypothetical protein
MPLARFHPAVQRWFSDTLGTPTPAQTQGWAAIRERKHTLIAAPTGSGKTLAAFLTALDDLFVEGLEAPLPDEVRVVYVSPLKALSADIHKNLAEPRKGIRRVAEELGIEAPRITAAVRTGDTTQSERAAMLRRPPHILVTTPESLYLLLTAEKSREMLKTARTVIVDEIHAVIGTRRGAHLAVTLERLQEVANAPLLRLGLSATQKPIEEVARYLAGSGQRAAGRDAPGPLLAARRPLWISLAVCLFALTHVASRFGLPEIVEVRRNASWLAMALAILLGVVCAELARMRAWKPVVAVLLVLWLWRVPLAGTNERLINYSGFSGTAQAVLDIQRKLEPFTWTLVTYGQEFPMVLGKGFHIAAAEFLERYDPAARRLAIPTRFVFLAVEKTPHRFQINSWAAKFSRADLEQRLQTWCFLYQLQHRDMRVFRDDEHVRVYVIDRGTQVGSL